MTPLEELELLLKTTFVRLDGFTALASGASRVDSEEGRKLHALEYKLKSLQSSIGEILDAIER